MSIFYIKYKGGKFVSFITLLLNLLILNCRDSNPNNRTWEVNREDNFNDSRNF